jgi:reactive intermediate/imine deaminase
MSEGVRHAAVQSDTLPKPAGPYSPAVAYGQLVFVSGQAAKDPATGQLVGNDIESQTEQVLKNIAVLLEAAGSSLDDVLRCGVFLKDITEFGRIFPHVRIQPPGANDGPGCGAAFTGIADRNRRRRLYPLSNRRGGICRPKSFTSANSSLQMPKPAAASCTSA